LHKHVNNHHFLGQMAEEDDAAKMAACLQRLQQIKAQVAKAQEALEKAAQALQREKKGVDDTINHELEIIRREFRTLREEAEALHTANVKRAEAACRTNIEESKANLKKAKRQQWERKESEIRERTQSVMKAAEDTMKPLEEALKHAQKVLDLHKIQERSEKETLQIYMPREVDESTDSQILQEQHHKDPRETNRCRRGDGCQWAFLLGKCKFQHTERERTTMDEQREKWLATPGPLVWPQEKFGKFEVTMKTDMIVEGYSSESQRKLSQFLNSQRSRRANESSHSARGQRNSGKRSRSRERGYSRERNSTSRRRITESRERSPLGSRRSIQDSMQKSMQKSIQKSIDDSIQKSIPYRIPNVQVVKKPREQSAPELETAKGDTKSKQDLAQAENTPNRTAKESDNGVLEACDIEQDSE
jgi:hypothetical protein